MSEIKVYLQVGNKPHTRRLAPRAYAPDYPKRSDVSRAEKSKFGLYDSNDNFHVMYQPKQFFEALNSRTPRFYFVVPTIQGYYHLVVTELKHDPANFFVNTAQ